MSCLHQNTLSEFEHHTELGQCQNEDVYGSTPDSPLQRVESGHVTLRDNIGVVVEMAASLEAEQASRVELHV